MNHITLITSLVAASLCCACPGRQKTSYEQDDPQNESATQNEPIVNYFNICVVPDAMGIDPELQDIAVSVSDYWTGQGYSMRAVEAGDNCLTLLDVNEVALAADGWGFKEAQTWIPNTITETNPVIARFKLDFWVDSTTTLELKKALAAHEIGHVLLGPQHEPEATGKLMSPIVTEDVAQALFGGSE